jgi:hypothetical protein
VKSIRRLRRFTPIREGARQRLLVDFFIRLFIYVNRHNLRMDFPLARLAILPSRWLARLLGAAVRPKMKEAR